ncbi:hypothetical protein KCU67_g11, partial [Aureobasidium melanogenum]
MAENNDRDNIPFSTKGLDESHYSCRFSALPKGSAAILLRSPSLSMIILSGGKAFGRFRINVILGRPGRMTYFVLLTVHRVVADVKHTIPFVICGFPHGLLHGISEKALARLLYVVVHSVRLWRSGPVTRSCLHELVHDLIGRGTVPKEGHDSCCQATLFHDFFDKSVFIDRSMDRCFKLLSGGLPLLTVLSHDVREPHIELMDHGSQPLSRQDRTRACPSYRGLVYRFDRPTAASYHHCTPAHPVPCRGVGELPHLVLFHRQALVRSIFPWWDNPGPE